MKSNLFVLFLSGCALVGCGDASPEEIKDAITECSDVGSYVRSHTQGVNGKGYQSTKAISNIDLKIYKKKCLEKKKQYQKNNEIQLQHESSEMEYRP